MDKLKLGLKLHLRIKKLINKLKNKIFLVSIFVIEKILFVILLFIKDF